MMSLETFRDSAGRGNVIRLERKLMSDQLTPVLGYRRLVKPDERTAPSFLLESVEGGTNVGRHSYIGAQPSIEIFAHQCEVTVLDHRNGSTKTMKCDDPLNVVKEITATWSVPSEDKAGADRRFTGGWVGYVGYDTVRFAEPEKIPFSSAPKDDRELPDIHLALYRQVGVFDHVEKTLSAIHHVVLDEYGSIDEAYRAGCVELEEFVTRLETHSVPLAPGTVEFDCTSQSTESLTSNFTKKVFEHAVTKCREYIAAGDIYQVVISQRFERNTSADPFDIYRALRIVNPSPYMIYLQCRGSILVGASPEILCRCENGTVTNRPLAGTRPRGATDEADEANEQELRADAKERAEHVMLVDLGRNDLGKVCETESIRLEKVMDIERYSHVMHLSSTITGRLKRGLDCWDALRATLPVGTVSGAPKVRAMQIIDEIEPTRRGPYAGGIGAIGFKGDMDMAIALRTMVIPTGKASRHQGIEASSENNWTVHLQAGAGIVADSVPAREYEETVSKAAALNKAIDLAETAFR